MFRWLAISFGFVLFGLVAVFVGFLGILHYFGRDLPDYQQLADYELPVTTRVYASDGALVKEYSRENRIFTPIALMPDQIINSFIASEDKNFYNHPGIDPQGMLRALLNNIINRGKKRPEGASTITQQVAKNFFLSNEATVKRKIKEAILSFRIERALSKDRILELYLNKIYFGYGAFGVTSAALNYFDKTLEELTLAEIAYLAALPKAPANYHPVNHYDAAIARRNYVLNRMHESGSISKEDMQKAQAEPITIVDKRELNYRTAEYYAEEVRRVLMERYGMQLYDAGLCVRTPLDLEIQGYADEAMRFGLSEYDKRHGWRGPITHVSKIDHWQNELKHIEPPEGMGNWRLAVVLGNKGNDTEIGFADGTKGTIPASLKWGTIKTGDVIPVELQKINDKGLELPPATYAVRQIPLINGGFVALDAHTGRVYAVAGGFSYDSSEFNRATQAMRQTGSAFKPFIYLTALENGLTPNSMILDAPVTIHLGQGLPPYTPKNYGGAYKGMVTLRKALEGSLNSAAVRLMAKVGVEKVAEMGERLGIADHMPRRFSIALGAQETTPLRMAAAYAAVVNGGKKVTPAFIDSIQDRHGKMIYRHDKRHCPGCVTDKWENQEVPVLQDEREQILNPLTAYQLVSIMEGVVKRGTAVRLKDFPNPLAAKTGTSTGFHEAWFSCYTPDIVTVTYVGDDAHKPIGNGETGSKTALPITKYFLERALKDVPPVPFRIPAGIRMVAIDPETGNPTNVGNEKAVYEPYLPGTEPTMDSQEKYIAPSVQEEQYVINERGDAVPHNPNASSFDGTAPVREHGQSGLPNTQDSNIQGNANFNNNSQTNQNILPANTEQSDLSKKQLHRDDQEYDGDLEGDSGPIDGLY